LRTHEVADAHRRAGGQLARLDLPRDARRFVERAFGFAELLVQEVALAEEEERETAIARVGEVLERFLEDVLGPGLLAHGRDAAEHEVRAGAGRRRRQA